MIFGISSPVTFMMWKAEPKSYFANWPRQPLVTSSPFVALFHFVCQRKTSRLSFQSKGKRTFTRTEQGETRHGCTKIKVEMQRNKKENVWVWGIVLLGTSLRPCALKESTYSDTVLRIETSMA